MSTPKSVIELAKKAGAKMVDIKFVDTFGTWQHFSCPIRELTEDVFAEDVLGEFADGTGEMLPGAEGINELDVHHLGAGFLG